jgi:uncharacterized protein (DUF3084 family)
MDAGQAGQAQEGACLQAEIDTILRCLQANISTDAQRQVEVDGVMPGSSREGEEDCQKKTFLLQKALDDLQEKLKSQFALQRGLIEEKQSLQDNVSKFQDEANQLRTQLRDLTVPQTRPSPFSLQASCSHRKFIPRHPTTPLPSLSFQKRWPSTSSPFSK